jgi:hypothetical protein
MLQTILRDLLAHALPTERLQAYLPFQTSIRRGTDHIHIVNESVFSVETRYHFIHTNETLCGRRKRSMADVPRGTAATCPGCTAIAKGVVARHITPSVETVNAVRLVEVLARL